MVAVTPEMAREELRRRKSSSTISSITPDMARQELQRRSKLQGSPQSQEKLEEGFLEKSTNSVARGTRNALAGTLDTLDFLATPVRSGLNVGAKALGSKYEVPTLAGETTKSIDKLTGGITAPKNETEKTEEAIQRGIGGMPIGAGIGMAAKGLKNAPKAIEAAGKFLRGSNVMTPTNVAASGATSGLIQSHLNENPEDVSGAIQSGILGGLSIPVAKGALGALTKKGRQGIASKTGEVFKINPEAVESFEKSGITPTLPDVSQGKISKLVSSKLEHVPFASHPIVNAKELQKKQILEGLGQGEHGLSRGKASKLVTKGAKEYQKGKEKNFQQMFSKVEEDIAKIPDDNVGIENTTKYFDKILSKIKTSSQEKAFKQSPIGKMYVDLYESAQQNGGKLPYHDMKDRLDQINDMITTHGLIGKVSQGKLKQFASNLSKDIEKDLDPKFKALGKDSYSNWKDAKKYYSEYAQSDIPNINELYKKDKKGATDAFIDLMTNQKKGAEKSKIALQGLDHKQQVELIDSIHKELGRASDGTFSPLKWVRGFKNLEPEAKKVILSPLDKSNQKKIEAIADTIDNMKSTLAEANTSKTAYHTALGALGAAGLKSTASLLGGNPLPLASLATGLFIGNRISEKILTNPKFINWMYKGMKAKNINQFQKILNNVPNVGEGRKILQREVQTFQHDLEIAKEKNENKSK